MVAPIRISRKRRTSDPESQDHPRRLGERGISLRQRLLHLLRTPLHVLQRVRALPPLHQLVLLFFTLVFGYLIYSRRARLGLLYTVSLGTIGQHADDSRLEWPPRYEDVKEMQAGLPQHNVSLPYPEGATGRYVRFTSQIWQLGWNNVFNELLMLTLLAQRSGRAYVFEDYVWKQDYYPWGKLKAFDVPSRTPLPALISGPTAGGPWDPTDTTSARSVHEAFWEKVCPPAARKVIWTHHIKKQHDLYEKSATEIFEVWRKILEGEPSRCVEVAKPPRHVEDYGQVFDLWLWGSERILDIWETFKDSAVSRLLKASPIIDRAVERNTHLFYPPRGVEKGVDPFDSVFAVHLRRGDFKGACQSLADWKSSFYSWNQLAWLPDRFPQLPGGVPGKNTPENVRKYFERCLPDKERIIERINGARRDYEREVFGESLTKHKVNVLFILTNDRTPWFQDLRARLESSDWKIVTTHDIVLTSAQEKDVSMAVDMELARKAAIFIGNGWSSFTSNIVHRRLVDKKIPLANRFF